MEINVISFGDTEAGPLACEWIREHITPTYRDTTGMNEHLYDLNGYLDEYDENEDAAIPEAVKTELELLNALLSEKECAYIRIV